MRRAIIVTVALFFIFVLVSTNEVLKDNEEENIEFREAVSDYIYKSNIENNCLSFLNEKMTSPSGGIYTNYLNSKEVRDYATGHQVLSESMGLIMLYHSRNNQKDGFDIHYNYLTEHMLMGDSLIAWRYNPNADETITTVSSTIDDLRIARALLYAYTRWKEDKYLDLARNIASGLINKVSSNNILMDYYDTKDNKAAVTVSTQYLDLYTMQILGELDNRWNETLKESKKLLKESYIADAVPFYKPVYNLKTKEYEIDDGLNMTEALVTILHLAEINEVNSKTITWLKEKLKNGDNIYTYYDYEGNRIVSEQSTAIYALICRVGKQIDDEELYNLSFRRLDDYYVSDKDSVIFGSFGDKRTLEVYSYDNLQGLLAF